MRAMDFNLKAIMVLFTEEVTIGISEKRAQAPKSGFAAGLI